MWMHCLYTHMRNTKRKIKCLIKKNWCQFAVLIWINSTWCFKNGFPSEHIYLILKSKFYVPISFKITPLIGTLTDTYHFFRIVLLWSNGKYHCHGFENNNLTETKSKFHRSTFDMAFGLLYAWNTVFFVSENNLKDKGHSQQPLLQLFFSLGKEK